MSQAKSIRHYSAISWTLVFWLFGVLFTVFILAMVSSEWPALLIVGPVIAFVTHMFCTTYYEIESGVLLIKCGFLYRQRIPISTIIALQKSNDWASSPALSFKRYKLKYNGGYVIISPKDPKKFIADLESAGAQWQQLPLV
jgi:hypothetical protein